MFPFAQQTPNQHSSGASASPQVPGNSVNFLQNLMHIQSQMGIANPQSSMPFNVLNTNSGNGRPPGPMNIPNFNPLQNIQMGNSILGSGPMSQSHGGFVPQNFTPNLNVNGQLGNLGQGNPAQMFGPNMMNYPRNMNPNLASNFNNGQFGWQNQVQNMNQLGSLALLNPSQVAALAQLMGCANQVAQPMIPQNTVFRGNPPQLNVLQPNGVAQQANFGQQLPPQLSGLQPNGVAQQANFGQQLPVASQQMQSGSFKPSNHTQNIQRPGWQGNHGNKHGMHISNSNHHQNNNIMKNPRREAPGGRFQKSQGQHKFNKKGNHKFSKENGGKGIGSNGPDHSANQLKSGKKRSSAALYTVREIQQWREQRKKNYPSKANVEKKLARKQANADTVAEEAKLRRQQLKEVLAKQAELGFEIPEIPSHYLLDSEDHFHGGNRNQRPLKRGRSQKRFDNQGRFDKNNRFNRQRGPEGNDSFRKNDQSPKRQRLEDNDSSKAPLNIKKPTLLQKLLSTDIKRDNSRLLQAFRFMVMNSFFEDWPEKPLNFPKVIDKENEDESEVTKDIPSSSKGGLPDIAEYLDNSDGSDGEEGRCQEEGEITD